MPCVAQQQEPEPASYSDEQLRAEIKRLQEEAEAIIHSPNAPASWRQLVAGEAELKMIDKRLGTEREAVRKRADKLAQSPELRGIREHLSELQGRIRTLHFENQRRALGAGQQLMKSRHEELAKLAPPETPRLRQLGLDVLTYPRMDGSTSTHPLAVLIASRCFGTEYGWTGRRDPRFAELGNSYGVYNSSYIPTVQEPEFQLAEFTMQAKAGFSNDERLVAIVNRLLSTNSSTHDAYVKLINGDSDIGLLARGPSADELETARKANVEIVTAPVAQDAFVILVNERNPVRSITTQGLRDVYAGKIKSWKDLGGNDQPISAYQREDNSGSQELMRDLVMKDVPFDKPNKDYQRNLISAGMGGPFSALTGDENGLAYSVYYYEHYMSGSARTRMVAVDGVEPTYETIRDRTYPLTSEVLIVTRKDLAADAPAARLRDWLLSEEGQAIVRESGYVPISALGK